MTNKVILRTTEEFMQDFTPIYQPIFSLFLGKSQSYPQVVGTLDFRRADTVGDIRAKHILPKDTNIAQIAVASGKKSFKKYFLANQYVQSTLQDSDGNEDVIAQVLDEHNRQADELLLLGEGTSNSTMINNGLYWSADANYDLENSVQVAKGTDADHLKDLHAKILSTAEVANQIAGRKAVVLYGSTVIAKSNGLYASSDSPWISTLEDVLGEGYSVVKLPADVTPSGANGYMVINLDQIKLHYTVLPGLQAQGVNEEKMYSWHNFVMGSMMVEVLVSKGIIRQPVTFEA